MGVYKGIDFIAGDGICMPPSVYIEAEAARRLAEARASVTETCEVTGDDWEREVTWNDVLGSKDPYEKHELVLRLAKECKGVLALRTNGLLVVAQSGKGPASWEGRQKVRNSFQNNGLDPKYGVALHKAFGDSIAESAGDIATAMLRSYAGNGWNLQITKSTAACNADGRQMQESAVGAPQTAKYTSAKARRDAKAPLMMAQVDRFEVEETLRQYGIETTNVNLERVCFEMAANGLDASELRDVLKRRSEIGYIAGEYGVSYDIASAVHESLTAETKGMIDVGVLKKMDLSLRVEALRHEAERSPGKISIAGYDPGEGLVVRVSDIPEDPELMEVLGMIHGDDDPDSPEYDPRLPEFDAVAPSGRLYRFKQKEE